MAEIAHAGLAREQSGWREFETAREARQALLRLNDLSPSNAAVLTLRRVETLELIHAAMKRHGLEYSSADMTEQDWKTAEAVDAIHTLRLPDAQRAALEASLAGDGQSYLLRLDAAGRRRAARSLSRTAQRLIQPFYLDSMGIERLRLQRWLRCGAASLVLVVLSGFGANRIQMRQPAGNLAFHRPVTVSTTMGAAYSSTDRLVDGDVHNLGFHTTSEDPAPWAIIDLGASKQFSKVVVHNREDCCQERAVPLVLEVSQDGTKFERLAERAAKFNEWTVRNLTARGRFVRLRLEGSGMFHLAEVGVYP